MRGEFQRSAHWKIPLVAGTAGAFFQIFQSPTLTALAIRACFIYRFITLTLFTRVSRFSLDNHSFPAVLLALLFHIPLAASRNRTNNEEKAPFQRGDEQILAKFRQLQNPRTRL